MTRHVCGHCGHELAREPGANWAGLVCRNSTCEPTVERIRERLARDPHPYTDAAELRVLLARIDAPPATVALGVADAGAALDALKAQHCRYRALALVDARYEVTAARLAATVAALETALAGQT